MASKLILLQQFLNTEGDGVRVYVLDSGIFKGHEVFGGTNVFDFKNRTNTPYCGGGQEDQVQDTMFPKIE
jgi:hypothetical protein